VEEWEQMAGEVDFEGEGWDKKVEAAKPDIEQDQATVCVMELRTEVKELKEMLKKLLERKEGNGK
jgi:cation-transporting ATPase 13A1